MAYGHTVTTFNLLGGLWAIRVAETLASSSDGIDILLSNPNGDASAKAIPFTKFQLLQVESVWLSGAGGATIRPKLQRYLEDLTTLRTMFYAGTAAAFNVWTFDPGVLIHATKLKHFANVDAGVANSIWTEYLIQQAD